MTAKRDPHPATPTITPATQMTSRCIPPREKTLRSCLSVPTATQPLPSATPVADSFDGSEMFHSLLGWSQHEKCRQCSWLEEEVREEVREEVGEEELITWGFLRFVGMPTPNKTR